MGKIICTGDNEVVFTKAENVIRSPKYVSSDSMTEIIKKLKQELSARDKEIKYLKREIKYLERIMKRRVWISSR